MPKEYEQNKNDCFSPPKMNRKEEIENIKEAMIADEFLNNNTEDETWKNLLSDHLNKNGDLRLVQKDLKSINKCL